MKRFVWIMPAVLAAALAGLFAGCSKPAQSSGAAAPKPVTIRLAFETEVHPDNQYYELALQFQDQVNTLSNGTMAVEIFGGGQLGTERENFEAVQMGTLEMASISNANLGAFAPPAIAIDLPGMFPSKEAAYAALEGPAGQAIVAAVEQMTGVKGLAFGEAGFRHMVTNNKPIRSVQDMLGLKIRVMQNEMYVTTYKTIGANAVPMAYSEVLTALQQKTIDGCDAPLQMIISGGFYNVCKDVSLTGHFYNALQLIINGKFYNSLSPDQQNILSTAAKNAAPKQRAVLAQKEDVWIKQLKDAGVTVVMPDEINLKDLDAKLADIYTAYANQIGGTYVQDLQAAARK